MAFDFIFGSVILIGCFSYLVYSLIRGFLRMSSSKRTGTRA